VTADHIEKGNPVLPGLIEVWSEDVDVKAHSPPGFRTIDVESFHGRADRCLEVYAWECLMQYLRQPAEHDHIWIAVLARRILLKREVYVRPNTVSELLTATFSVIAGERTKDAGLTVEELKERRQARRALDLW